MLTAVLVEGRPSPLTLVPGNIRDLSGFIIWATVPTGGRHQQGRCVCILLNCHGVEIYQTRFLFAVWHRLLPLLLSKKEGHFALEGNTLGSATNYSTD